MITKEILQFINSKLNSIIFSLVLVGILFFIMALAILFYPEILQMLFVAAFFIISFLVFLMAVKVYNIKEHFDRITDIFPKKKK